MEKEKEKRIERAQKFGLYSKELAQEKRKERAERFGMNAGGATGGKPVGEEDDRKK